VKTVEVVQEKNDQKPYPICWQLSLAVKSTVGGGGTRAVDGCDCGPSRRTAGISGERNNRLPSVSTQQRVRYDGDNNNDDCCSGRRYDEVLLEIIDAGRMR
jgi:hypothetical protein